MSLSLNRFLNVKLINSPTAIRVQDQTLSLFVTNQSNDNFIDNLYMYVSEQSEVEKYFGTYSDIAKATAKAFGHPLRPSKILIGYWNQAGVKTPARKNSLTATQQSLPFSSLAKNYQFTIKSRNVAEVVTYTSDSKVVDLDTFRDRLNTILTGSSRFAFTQYSGIFSLNSKVNGKDVDTDNITIEVSPFEANNIIRDLRLSEDYGAVQVRGVSETSPKPQTITDFISAIDSRQPYYYGFYSAVNLTDDQIVEAHDRLLASSEKHIFAYTALADYMLDTNNSNPLYRIATKNSRIMLVQLHKLNDRHAVVEALVQATSTNWDGQNTAQTLKFKTGVSVQSDEGVDAVIANKADLLGINYYTDYSGTTFLAEGRTLGTELFFIDSTVGRHALVNRLQAAAATRLIQQPKIPQTDEGQITLQSSLIPVLDTFVRNGFIGERLVWNNIGFGILNTGDVLNTGYYMYSDSYTTQSQSDREARKAMPIQIAVKEAGAIHSADILVYVER